MVRTPDKGDFSVRLDGFHGLMAAARLVGVAGYLYRRGSLMDADYCHLEVVLPSKNQIQATWVSFGKPGVYAKPGASPSSRQPFALCAVESQQVYGNGLDRLWRVLAVMLNPIGIAPHRVEGKRFLLRP